VDGVSVRGGYSPDFQTRDPALFETIIQRPDTSDASIVDAGTAGASVVFDGFTITGGNASFSGGGMFCGPFTGLTISNCRFVRNFATVTGGGLQLSSSTTAIVTRCLFQENSAGQRGGAITAGQGADGALIELCTVEACSSGSNGFLTGGGAIFAAAGIRLERNKIRNNYSATHGGGLYVSNVNIRAWGNLFTENQSAHDGGAIYHEGGSGEHRDTLVEDCLAGADGFGNGGGVYFEGGTNRWVRGFIRGNSAVGDGLTSGLGGGVHFHEDNGLIEGAEIVQNVALAGGGVFCDGGSTTWNSPRLDHCTIALNASTNMGTGSKGRTLPRSRAASLPCSWTAAASAA
jgi:predicted outer membrane repeat protein